MLRFSTAGESHGESLVALLSGLPAGVPVEQAFVDRELWRRQQGYGRGGRMKVETDTVSILSGVRHGQSLGTPIALAIHNKDWPHWEKAMSAESMTDDEILNIYTACYESLITATPDVNSDPDKAADAEAARLAEGIENLNDDADVPFEEDPDIDALFDEEDDEE
jgi:hypothetical protein